MEVGEEGKVYRWMRFVVLWLRRGCIYSSTRDQFKLGRLRFLTKNCRAHQPAKKLCQRCKGDKTDKTDKI